MGAFSDKDTIRIVPHCADEGVHIRMGPYHVLSVMRSDILTWRFAVCCVSTMFLYYLFRLSFFKPPDLFDGES